MICFETVVDTIIVHAAKHHYLTVQRIYMFAYYDYLW